MLFAAMLAAVAAAMLMYNSIRTAVFARRREIEVMRLVGATKWFIRIPFMLEGLLQGLIGALVAVLAVVGLNLAFDNFFTDLGSFVFQDFALEIAGLVQIGGFLLVAGALLGAFSAGLAVTRYLDA
jgi:cell division transport system permease protein